MKIDAETYQKLPEHLQALFQKAQNLSHDEVVALFPQSSGGAWPANGARFGMAGGVRKQRGERTEMADTGSAARFFYCAKASKKDRGDGNNHPTVKPTDLMRYLCRLVTPPGGVVLDPFMGSGSTGKAAMLEGFRFIGCELSPEYAEIANKRIESVVEQLQTCKR